MALDTRAWNLGAMAFGAGACGPLVALPADTDGDTQGDDDDDDPSEPTPTTTSVPGDCNPACPPGYYCVDGFCEYPSGTSCIGECGGYYECFGHDDCYGQEYCNYYACTFLPYVYECAGGLAFSSELISELAGAVSLAFADTNGDGFEDLAALAEWAWVVHGPDASQAVPIDVFEPGYDGDVLATEFDGMPPTELTFSLPDAGLMFTVNVDGQPELLAASDPALQDPVAGDFDDDGRDDIASVTGLGIMALSSDGMQFVPYMTLRWDVGSRLSVGTLGTTPGEDFAFASGLVAFGEIWDTGGAVTMLEELYPMAVRTPVVGDFDDNGMDDVVALGQRPSSPHALVATWLQIAPGELVRQPYFGLQNAFVSDDGWFAAASGDMDDDGRDDIVVGGTGNVLVLFTGSPCAQGIPINSVARVVAVGDFDGDGRDDIAWSDAAANVGLIRAD